MGERGRMDRRSLFRRSTIAVAGAAAAGSTGFASDTDAMLLAGDGEVTASSLATVAGTRRDGSLVVRRLAGSRSLDAGDPGALAALLGPGLLEQPTAATVVVPRSLAGRERWERGHEVVLIEHYRDGRWTVSAAQRLYRPISETVVTGRRGSSLLTRAGRRLRLTSESRARAASGGHAARPLEKLEAGDVVEGMGFVNVGSEDCWLDVSLLGTRAPRP